MVLRDFSDLPGLLLDKFSKVKGIRSLVPAIAVDVIKYKFDVAPIDARSGA